MKNWSLLFAVLLVGCASKPMLESSNDLLGCWKGEKIVIFNSDGTSRTQPASTLCIISFATEKIITTCTSQQSSNSVGYTYSIARPGVYLAKIVSHIYPHMIGSEREYEYKIENDRLFIITYPQTTTPTPTSPAIRTESENSKISCVNAT
jgi:hypothetical protein